MYQLRQQPYYANLVILQVCQKCYHNTILDKCNHQSDPIGSLRPHAGQMPITFKLLFILAARMLP